MKSNAERIFAMIVPALSVLMALVLVGYTQLGYVAPVAKSAQAKSAFDTSDLHNLAQGDALAAAGAAGTAAEDAASPESAAATPAGAAASQVDPSDPSSWADGTFEASAYGWSKVAPIKLATTINNHRISSIDILSQNETPKYFAKARSVVGSIISAQSVGVDTVSGATMTSNGIIDAVSLTLSKSAELAKAQEVATSADSPAQGDSRDAVIADPRVPSAESAQSVPGDARTPDYSSTEISAGKVELADGIYTATKQCEGARYNLAALDDPYSEAQKEAAASASKSRFDYKFLGLLEVRSGKIKSFELYWDYVTPNDRSYIMKAWDNISASINSGAEIDVVTGATYSSAAICEIYNYCIHMAASKAEENKDKDAADSEATDANNDAPAEQDDADATKEGSVKASAQLSSSSDDAQDADDGDADSKKSEKAVKPAAKNDDAPAADDAPDDGPDDGE